MAEDADWRATRWAELSAEDGWLNLVARLPLGPGRQRLGTAPGADLVLPDGPADMGTLDAAAQTLTTPAGEVLAFAPGRGGFAMLRHDPFLLELHRVDDEVALRLRDLRLRPAVQLRYFPVDPGWRVVADWQALDAPRAQAIGQKGAGETVVEVSHVARFRRDGRDVTLLPTHWKAGRPMFVFRDGTSGRESYGAARFLIGTPEDGRILLDFNRAFTPPCGFTDFAICPLPPPGNVLPFRVEAGEMAPALP